MQVKCPTCQRAIEWASAPYRPFCSERCRLIDLGGWLTERHAIAGEAAALEGDGPRGREPPPREI
jgi:hypothetical protein